MRSRYEGIPQLEEVARRINERLGIPPMLDEIDPETGTHRPRGWYLIGRYSGRRVVPLEGDRKKRRGLFGLFSKK